MLQIGLWDSTSRLLVQARKICAHDLLASLPRCAHHQPVRDPTTPVLGSLSPSDLDSLMRTLEVTFVKLAECLVSPGWRLALPGTEAPGIHYNLEGSGTVIVGEEPPIPLVPHTLIVVPRGRSFSIEVANAQRPGAPLATVDGHWHAHAPGTLRRFVAGAGEPRALLICGYFRASYGGSVDLFASLTSTIVEQFDPVDRLDQTLRSALAELVAQEVGAGAMSAALLKVVLVTLLRRSLSSINVLGGRFSILRDPPIARAFAEMVARPGAPHSVESLARTAYLSRSTFMARFTALVGRSPMAALRELRLSQAATLLTTNDLSVDQIAQSVGYASRSSFARAFRKAYGRDPAAYRAAELRCAGAE